MASNGGTTLTRAREWIRSHPFIATGLGVVLGIGLGASSSTGSSDKDLEAELKSARAEVRSLANAEPAPVDDSLAEEIDSLEEENAELVAEIAQLNARRKLPSLVGDRTDDANDLEDEYGWNLSVGYRYSSERAGTILSQSPSAGTMMRYGAPFKVVVAKTIPKLPGLVGMKKDNAVKELRQAGYSVTIIEQVSTQKAGTVIAMSPGGGTRLVPGQAVTLTIAKKTPPPPPSTSTSSGAGCTPGYSPCLPPASDYDCLGGSGDGPKYTGTVTVTGSDPYGLDSDNDGVGCE